LFVFFKMLEFEGSNFLRQRVTLSLLSGTAVKVTKIRSFEDDPGLKGKKICFQKNLDCYNCVFFFYC